MTKKFKRTHKINKKVLILAGGTGGHIFPAIGFAQDISATGWQVHWVGAKGSAEKPSMESKLVPQANFPISYIDFSGVRGKGKLSILTLPWRLLKALWQSKKIISQQKPDVVVGFGGYVSFPVGLMSFIVGVPLVIHEQNAVAGTANKWLALIADRVFTAFPNVFAKGRWIGNPVRKIFFEQEEVVQRFLNRQGPLQLLVLGGSLGAKALNDLIPKAIALLPLEQRPIIVHQSGHQHLQQLKQNYEQAQVQAQVIDFIEDTAKAMAEADLMICRSGATTIAEITTVGVAAALVPYPFAIDDHQTKNAQFLVNKQAAWLLPQAQLTEKVVAELLQNLNREQLVSKALITKALRRNDTTKKMIRACEVLVEYERKN